MCLYQYERVYWKFYFDQCAYAKCCCAERQQIGCSHTSQLTNQSERAASDDTGAKRRQKHTIATWHRCRHGVVHRVYYLTIVHDNNSDHSDKKHPPHRLRPGLQICPALAGRLGFCQDVAGAPVSCKPSWCPWSTHSCSLPVFGRNLD